MQLPLTLQQRWLWGLLQSHAHWNCAVSYAFRLQGHLSVDVLQASLEEVTRRHGALHTRVTSLDGIPRQETEDPRAGRLIVLPVPGRSQAEIKDEAGRAFVEFAERIADPAIGPLLRVQLLKLTDHEHWLLIALHRLTADCFSVDQILRELWCLYREYLQGRPSPFRSDPPQYAEYALWQQQTRREWLERHEQYWQRRLDGAMAVRWPVDGGVPGAVRGTMARMSGWFDKTVSASLQDLARRARTLSATAMLAIYVAVLWKWCRQTDFVLPFNVAGRQAEHKSVVGYFSHILYLRLVLTSNETFTELLSSVSNEFFRALSHQDFGLMATREPQLLTGAFYQWITWHPDGAIDTPRSDELSQLSVERLRIREFGESLCALPPGMVDVDITFFDTSAGIYASGVYRADLFMPRTMERLMTDLRSACELFVRNPHAPVRTICDAVSFR